MILNSIEEFIDAAPSALIGLDVGEKTVGIAISDELQMVATPEKIINRSKFSKDAEEIKQLIINDNIGGMVIGYPRNMDGSEGAKCQSIKTFAINFLKIHELPVFLFDERLSTKAVTDTMLEADLSRARRKELVDKLAASYILQGCLDLMANKK